jgi:hypothetical protein
MTEYAATNKDAVQTSDEAGGTPLFDARCVTVAVGSSSLSHARRVTHLAASQSRNFGVVRQLYYTP